MLTPSEPVPCASMELMYTAHVPAGDGPFPTLVVLHGWGASAHDLLGLAPLLHSGEALVLCPQGKTHVPIAPGMDGYGWYPLSGGSEPDPIAVVAAADALRRFIDAALDTYPIDPQRLVLLGFSQGGFMAYELALCDPGRFSGLIALSAWLPDKFAAATEPRPEYEKLPALVVHGTEDRSIPVERGQDSRDALLRLGVPTVYRDYEMGHEIHPEALREIGRWLEDTVLTPAPLA